jgi:hypothetical protein
MSIVVSAFPGVGKIYLKKSSNLKIVDINSVEYKYISKIANSFRFREPNVEYPSNLINKVRELIASKDAPDVIFVPSHAEVRAALNNAGIEYFIVYPNLRDKNEFIARYRERGNSEKFCMNMEHNWERFIDGIINETFPIHIKSNKITEEMLLDFKEYTDCIARSKQVAKGKEISCAPSNVNWSIVSRERRNWNNLDFAFKDYIDWDMLSKFGKIPDAIIANKQYQSYIVWRYLEKNKSKYSLKTRKLISKNV